MDFLKWEERRVNFAPISGNTASTCWPQFFVYYSKVLNSVLGRTGKKAIVIHAIFHKAETSEK
jgi:hypothetical protein